MFLSQAANSCNSEPNVFGIAASANTVSDKTTVSSDSVPQTAFIFGEKPEARVETATNAEKNTESNGENEARKDETATGKMRSHFEFYIRTHAYRRLISLELWPIFMLFLEAAPAEPPAGDETQQQQTLAESAAAEQARMERPSYDEVEVGDKNSPAPSLH